MKKIKSSISQKAFTLIELLIVIGILAILIVTVLVAINPAEAQRKARDAKRLKDSQTLNSIVGQAVNDGIVTAGCLTSAAGCRAATAGALQSQSCTANWLQINTCAYAGVVPVDPNNGIVRTFVTGAAGTTAATAGYEARILGSDYEIRVRQESPANRASVNADGGDDPDWAEVGTLLTIL